MILNPTAKRKMQLDFLFFSIDKIEKKVYNSKSEGNGVFRHFVGIIVRIFVLKRNFNMIKARASLMRKSH